ncbi:MAG TPA: hypothetical protein PLO44_00320 [Candidatus Paceibacterota bacterium]|nr:hypothetical protein [Candidatus Paceibacterota bacterium]
MTEDLLFKIKEKSSEIDWADTDIKKPLSINFPVPVLHARYPKIQQYLLSVAQLSNYHFLENDLIICDIEIKKHLTKNIADLPNIIFLEAAENKTKILSEANILVKQVTGKNYKRILAIGGGIIANIASYIAEKLEVDIVHVPTTVLSMSDASIGGKVRVNDIQGNTFIKHAYKTFYEPSEIVLDPLFLTYLSDEQIRIGLAEIIKHALYQSPLLAEYLLSDAFQPFTDRLSLLRAILWVADLKRICLEIDPEETKNGSYKILRAAHDISDKLEERSGFTLPHGKAVEKAMVEDLYSNKGKSEQLARIYQKLGIGYTTVFS